MGTVKCSGGLMDKEMALWLEVQIPPCDRFKSPSGATEVPLSKVPLTSPRRCKWGG